MGAYSDVQEEYLAEHQPMTAAISLFALSRKVGVEKQDLEKQSEWEEGGEGG